MPFAHGRLCKTEEPTNVHKTYTQDTCDTQEEQDAQDQESPIHIHTPTEPDEQRVDDNENISVDTCEEEEENTLNTNKKKQLSQRLYKLAHVIEQLEAAVKEFESLEDIDLALPE